MARHQINFILVFPVGPIPLPSLTYSSLEDFILFPGTFVQGGFAFPGPSYSFEQNGGEVSYSLYKPGASTGYYNRHPTVTLTGTGLAADSQGLLSGTIRTMVFSSENRGQIATLSGLSVQGSAFTDLLLARIGGDTTSYEAFQKMIADELVEITTRDKDESIRFRYVLEHLDRFDLAGGHDTLWVSLTGDHTTPVFGGAGYDTLDIDFARSNVDYVVDLGAGEIRFGSEVFRFSGFEKVVGHAFTRIYLGSEGPDNIEAAGRDDTITAGGGYDLVNAGWGDDSIDAGDGNDTVDAGPGADVVDGGNGDDMLEGGDGDDTLRGGNGDDSLSGQKGDDIIEGGNGNDSLLGGSGDDILRGGAASDRLIGDTGADLMDGGNNSDIHFVDALDTVTDTGTTGYDKAQINDASGVQLSLTGWSGVERVNGYTGVDHIDASSQSAAILLFGGEGDDTLIGGQGNDVLIGGAGDDVLSGLGGNDVLLGSAGADQFDGGAGNDTFFIGEQGDAVIDGGSGFDKAVITDASGLSLTIGAWLGLERINGLSGNDSIDATGMATSLVMSGSAGDDILTGGASGDTLFGGSGDDTLFGGAGHDALIGSAGADLLDGGGDNDFYLGGAGADVFAWSEDFGRDVVKDFTDGVDRLSFASHGAVTALGDLSIAQSGTHTVITLAVGGTDRITLVDTLASQITGVDFDFV